MDKMLKERLDGLENEDNRLSLIFETAYKVHSEKPFDAAHDWEHHAAVCTNGLEIIEKENLYQKVDLPVFVAASLFHDLERGSKGHDLAVAAMHEVGFSKEFLNAVVVLINQHSFGDKQTCLEGKILWAADKIEYVSKARFVHSLDKMSKAKIVFYKRLWRSRIEDVTRKFQTLDLPAAREIFFIRFKELKSFIDRDQPQYKSWIKGLKLEMV